MRTIKPYTRASGHQEKITWLLKNQALWEGFPYNACELTKEHYNRMTNILIKMKNEGLYKHNVGIKQLKLFPWIRKARTVRQALAYGSEK